MATTTIDARRSNKALYWIIGALALVALIVLISANRTSTTPATDMIAPPTVDNSTTNAPEAQPAAAPVPAP